LHFDGRSDECEADRFVWERRILLPAEDKCGKFHTKGGIVEQLKHLRVCGQQQQQHQEHGPHLFELSASAKLFAVHGHEAGEPEVIALQRLHVI
jgi:hypothetical protein